MISYISSATVIFVSKSKAIDRNRLASVTVCVDHNSGCTVSGVFEFLRKNPIVKANLRDYNILSVTFNYSEL